MNLNQNNNLISKFRKMQDEIDKLRSEVGLSKEYKNSLEDLSIKTEKLCEFLSNNFPEKK